MNKKLLYGGIGGGIGCLFLLFVIAAIGGGWYYFNEERKSNERHAIYGLQNIAEAQKDFFLKELNLRYATRDELKSSGKLNGYGGYLLNGSHGYRLRMENKNDEWQAVAEPESYGFFNGYRSFAVGIDGQVRGRTGPGATLKDPPASPYY